MNATAWFFIVVGAVIVAAVGYGMARRARGSIELSLPKTDFEPGETIHGSFVVQTKQPVEAERLVVTLTATEVTETVKEGKTSTSSRQVLREERVLEEARAYAAGTRETREFAIDLPDPEPAPEPGAAVGHAGIGQLKALRRPRTRLVWRLEVRLAAKGIDLVASRPVTVNVEAL